MSTLQFFPTRSPRSTFADKASCTQRRLFPICSAASDVDPHRSTFAEGVSSTRPSASRSTRISTETCGAKVNSSWVGVVGAAMGKYSTWLFKERYHQKTLDRLASDLRLSTRRLLMKKTATRSLFAYSIHGHMTNRETFDYAGVFQSISDLEGPTRSVSVEGRVFVLRRFDIHDGRVLIIANEGDRDVAPLFYDSETNIERVGSKRRSEILSTRTHAIIDIASRISVVEFNHRGARASHIIRVITRMAQHVMQDVHLQMDLAPIAGDEFTHEINQMDRIMWAEISAFEPNASWDDMSVNFLAGESGARIAKLKLIAPPKSSLSGSRGLVRFLRELEKSPHPNVREAAVKGVTMQGETKTVKLKNHVEKSEIEVSMSKDDGYPKSDAVIDHLQRYLSQVLVQIEEKTEF